MARQSSSKRRDKAALKRERKRKSLQKKITAKKEKSRRVKKAKPLMQPQEYVFWVMHGINFLVSNYDEGIWDPLFPEIYEGVLPSAETVAQRILHRFKDKKDDPREGLSIGWSVQPISTIHIYYLASVKAARVANPESSPAEVLELAKKPMSPYTWKIFNLLGIELARKKTVRKEAADAHA